MAWFGRPVSDGRSVTEVPIVPNDLAASVTRFRCIEVHRQRSIRPGHAHKLSHWRRVAARYKFVGTHVRLPSQVSQRHLLPLLPGQRLTEGEQFLLVIDICDSGGVLLAFELYQVALLTGDVIPVVEVTDIFHWKDIAAAAACRPGQEGAPVNHAARWLEVEIAFRLVDKSRVKLGIVREQARMGNLQLRQGLLRLDQRAPGAKCDQIVRILASAENIIVLKNKTVQPTAKNLYRFPGEFPGIPSPPRVVCGK